MRGKPTPMRDVLGRALGRLAVRDGRLLAAAWAEAAGPLLAPHATPEAVAGGVLTLRVSESAWRDAVAAETGRIVARLRQIPGGGAIERIVLVGP